MADINFSNPSRDPDSRAAERRPASPGAADLLDVLRITKQSLGRVLKQLLDEGYIVQQTGNNDRRQRLLFATAKGEALVARLAGLQTDRINGAIGELDAAGADTVRQFLRGMIGRDDPDKVLQAIFGTGSATAKE